MSDIIEYENIIVGAGIAGCSLAYFLSKKSDSVLLIDKNSDVAFGASGAAGAFLSPLLGKPNKFKDLVSESLKFSVDFYKENFPLDINNCGTCRIPKNQEDKDKFESYKEYMDFDYKEFEEGFLFDIGSVVNSYNMCKNLSNNVEKKFDYEVEKLEKYDDDFWLLNKKYKAKRVFLTTGANIDLINEKYFNIRAVWGQRINIFTTSCIDVNYHKECSLSVSTKIENENRYKVSIGATHNRFKEDMSHTSYDLKKKNINNTEHNSYTKKIIDKDMQKLLSLANDIKSLNDVELIDVKIGARSSSVDYFPMVGKLVDSEKTIEKNPHFVNGSFVKDENLLYVDNLFVLNGVGGRGFVLSPYLANELVENIYNNKKMSEDIVSNRLFKRWVKRIK